ncbi:MAG: hypothetical protein ACPIOQ_04700 [Promethearchaeia archaeon]
MAAVETARWAALVAEGWRKAAKAAEGWRLVAAFTTGYVPIEVWVSPEELLVVHANVSGPLVNSYIVVPTECLSDNGLPHTLEHLCFLGSQDFPFKGVLDKAAFRNLATGKLIRELCMNARACVHSVCLCVCEHAGAPLPLPLHPLEEA